MHDSRVQPVFREIDIDPSSIDVGRLLRRRGSARLRGWSDDRPADILLPWASRVVELRHPDVVKTRDLFRMCEGWRSKADSDSGEIFVSGWIAMIAYEVGAAHEGSRFKTGTPEPATMFARHDRSIVLRNGRTYIHCSDDELDASIDDIRDSLRSPATRRIERQVVHTSLDAALHRSQVEKIRELIARGEVYQVNLTRRFEVEASTDAVALLDFLTAGDSTRCSALLRGDDWTVASASPEVFLSFDRATGEAASRPIKGTIEKHGDPLREQEALESSAKDAAEHLMIVDLVRNDFGKIAPPSHVTVDDYRKVIELPNLFHLESKVVARGLEDVPLDEIFFALFPAGSITGAPKHAAVRFIEELEPVPRGIYTGAIGFIEDRGRAEFSVAIRTAVVTKQQVRYHAGGGIVWESDPHAEERETMAKARRFFRFFSEDE